MAKLVNKKYVSSNKKRIKRNRSIKTFMYKLSVALNFILMCIIYKPELTTIIDNLTR